MSKQNIGEVLSRALDIPNLKCLGSSGGGCINEALTFVKDDGEKIFVKVNHKPEARRMFDGELVSLEALYSMDIVRVPKPIKVLDLPGGGGAMMAMEYIDFSGLSRYSARLGEELARLHLLNAELGERSKKGEKFVGKSEQYKYVDKFGFDVCTCCGYIPQDNTWQDDWTTFYGRKMDIQIKLVEQNEGDREARELWTQILQKLPKFFEGLEIKPALLHGDLWGGNVGEMKDCPVIFDPASFYGHSEFDLAISKMFGGFDSDFFNAYHKVIPQSPGFRKRTDLYKLFHYINHWNHFGGGYRGQTISTLHKLIGYLKT